LLAAHLYSIGATTVGGHKKLARRATDWSVLRASPTRRGSARAPQDRLAGKERRLRLTEQIAAQERGSVRRSGRRSLLVIVAAGAHRHDMTRIAL